MHPAPVPHRRQIPLDGQPGGGQQGRAAKGHQAGDHPFRRLKGALHHCMALSALGPGYPGRSGRRAPALRGL